MSTSARSLMRGALVCALALGGLLSPRNADAQGNGRIVGQVVDETRTPVSGATLTVVGTRAYGISDIDGRYIITGVPAGSHEVRVQRIGQEARSYPNVVVTAGQATTLDVTVATSAISVGGVVVSASRRVEKVTDAPGTVTAIGPELLDNTVGNTFAAALKEAKGLDFIQVGMTAVAVNARGFNSSFNNRMLMVEDGRIAVLPENGLPVGSFTATPKVDLAGIEVLVGPGSALYGPDASNGVLSLRTKDPRQFQGTVVEVTGGNRSYKDIQARHAGVAGNFGYKVAAEWQDAEDWENYLTYNGGGTLVAPGTTGAVREDALKVPIDWRSRVGRGSAAVVYYMGQNRLEVNGGISQTDGVGQTSVGRNQLDNWRYNVVQARFSTPHWYFNAYRTQSTSGNSFALNRFAGRQATAATANLTADSLRMLADWPSDGRMYAAEAQGNYQLPMLLNSHVVFGAQYRNDVVSSDRQWLTDRVSGEDISNDQKGIYGQITTPVVKYLDVVLAGRLDYPSVYDEQWSPKAGVVIKPIENHALRVTFNRAYKSPTILQTNFFIPDWTSVVAIFGNTDGFYVQNAAGQTTATYKPVQPESNKTWEFGYKGILFNKLFIDGAYFHSDYDNFVSPLSIIANPFTGATATFAYPTANPNGIPTNAQGRIVNQAGTTPVMLTYFNLGNATVKGVDLGANFFATNKIELRGTVSTIEISDLEVTPAFSEATALNAPHTKWTLGATAKDLIEDLTAGLTFRNVNSYYFRSGVNTGVIPRFGTLDANLSYEVPGFGRTLVNLGVSNLFSCTAESVTYTAGTTPANSRIATQDRGCGFGRKHFEMINMPQIGTMVFLGVRVAR